MRRPARHRSLSSGSRLITAIALVLGAATFVTDFQFPTPRVTVPAEASAAAVWHGHAYYGTSRRVARRTSRRTASRHAGYGYGGVYGGAAYSAPVTTLPPNCTTVVSGGGAVQQCGGTTYTPYMQGSTVVYAP